METKNQTQNQRSVSNNNSQTQNSPSPKPKPQPPVKQPKDLVDNDESSDEEDSKADLRPIGKAHTDEQQMPKQKSNEAWQTGDSVIPENASDNPNS